jgi:hypothetical protein
MFVVIGSPAAQYCSSDTPPFMIDTPAEAPILVAPAAIISSMSVWVWMPPAAFTPISGPTVFRINATSDTVAPNGAEASRSLDEVGLGLLRQPRGDHLFLVGEEGGLEDDLGEGAFLASRFGDPRDIRSHEVVLAALESADVDDHVELGRAVAEGLSRFHRLDFRRVRS